MLDMLVSAMHAAQQTVQPANANHPTRVQAMAICPLARADCRTHLGSQTLTSVPGRRRQCWLGAAAASPAAALLAGRCASSCRVEVGLKEGHVRSKPLGCIRDLNSNPKP